jgi:hypothetical protein
MTHEYSQPAAEQFQPMTPGEAWQEAVQDTRLTESYLPEGAGVTLYPGQTIELPEAFDKVPSTLADEPLAIVYAGNPRGADNQPEKSQKRGTTFVVYGKGLSTENISPPDQVTSGNPVTKIGIRNTPRVFQIDTRQDTIKYVGTVREGGLVVGRNVSSVPEGNNDMSRMHFTVGQTADGGIGIVDHSKNGTVVLHPEQLDKTREYTAAHDLGQTIITSQVQQ